MISPKQFREDHTMNLHCDYHGLLSSKITQAREAEIYGAPEEPLVTGGRALGFCLFWLNAVRGCRLPLFKTKNGLLKTEQTSRNMCNAKIDSEKHASNGTNSSSGPLTNLETFESEERRHCCPGHDGVLGFTRRCRQKY